MASHEDSKGPRAPGNQKTCNVCLQAKPLSAFYKQGKNKNGTFAYKPDCKDCYNARCRDRYRKDPQKKAEQVKRYRDKNPEWRKAYEQKWYQENKERVLAYQAEYQAQPHRKEADKKRQAKRYAENREEIQAARKFRLENDPEAKARLLDYFQRHYRQNKAYYNEKAQRRNRVQKGATPKWADLEAIRDVYREARWLSKVTGVRHEVDHIVPLTSDVVCGLHVVDNLRVVLGVVNRRKANKLVEDIVRHSGESRRVAG